jgi:hypothetical protein
MKTEIQKWRAILDGGNSFIDGFLQPYSTRESAEDFAFRKSVTVNPAFAAGAIEDIKNAIFQRTTEIRRTSGCKTYDNAIAGLNGGVNGRGTSMNSFIGNEILIELVGMGRVGVLLSMEDAEGLSAEEASNIRPILTVYKYESILEYNYDSYGELEYVKIAQSKPLRDENGVVTGYEDIEVLMTRDKYIYPDRVDENKLGKVPFVLLELNHGLLRDIAQYQIALLNISSSDINYVISSNFPLYTEQKNSAVDIEDFLKGGKKETEMGVKHGRTYPIGTERPGFIHPSPEPLLASIEKQSQLKEELRQIVSLSLSTMRAKMESADSKRQDLEGLESGLASIGAILEAFERQIAVLWSLLEGSNEIAQIFYPERYEVKDIDKTFTRVAKSFEIAEKIPSKTGQKELIKRAVDLLLSSVVNDKVLNDIFNEIDESQFVIINPKTVSQDVTDGLLDSETAASVKYYPKDSVQKAQQERIDRAVAIAQAQMKEVRGVPETNPTGQTVVKTDKGGEIE